MSLGSYALTTLAGVKAQLRITGSSEDDFLEHLINAVSKRIEREAGRKFVADDYREWYTGVNQDYLVLRQRPVLRINRVLTGRENALQISYSGSAIYATVQRYNISGGGLQITTIASDGAATSNAFAFSTYASVSALETAINALSGWSATMTKNTLSDYLLPRGHGEAKDRTVTLDAAVDDYADYHIDEERGVIGFTSIGHHSNHYASRASRDVFGGGAIYTTSGVPVGYQDIMVDYRAGYQTTPADVDQLCRELVQQAYHHGKLDSNLGSESLGSYSYQLVDGMALKDAHRAMLDAYREIFVG